MQTIDNGTIRLSLLPEFGGRIVELTDLRTGRNWLVPGAAEGSAAQDAVFGVAQARGWDECFPSGAACDATPWPMRLRDHGEFWGRQVEVTPSTDGLAVTGRAGPAIFHRLCRLSGDEVVLTYAVENTGSVALPYLWGMHMLLALTPGERIDLPGVDRVDAAFLTHGGKQQSGGPLAFPQPDRPGLPDLGLVHPLTERFAAKVFAPVTGAFVARLGGAQGWIEIAWQAREIGHLGLWLDHGGWPDDGPVAQVCLAPTTAPFESLADALTAGKAQTLPPGQTRGWTIRLKLSA